MNLHKNKLQLTWYSSDMQQHSNMYDSHYTAAILGSTLLLLLFIWHSAQRQNNVFNANIYIWCTWIKLCIQPYLFHNSISAMADEIETCVWDTYHEITAHINFTMLSCHTLFYSICFPFRKLSNGCWVSDIRLWIN